MEKKCRDPKQLYIDISDALYSYFNNEPLQNSDKNVYINDTINYSGTEISITDNYGIHTYNILGGNSNDGYIHFTQDPINYSYSGDVSLNYTNTNTKIPAYKKITTTTNPQKTYNTNIDFNKLNENDYYYYKSIKSISDNTYNNGKVCNNKESIESSTYDTSNCTTTLNDNEKDDDADLFIRKLTSMSFDVFPNYSSINVYASNGTEPPVPKNDPGPMIETLVYLIADYYLNLCENKKKAEIYQNLVNNQNNSGSEELYQDTVNKYYREYLRILNISFGIIITTGIIYQFSK
jgi:hypothetical protein